MRHTRCIGSSAILVVEGGLALVPVAVLVALVLVMAGVGRSQLALEQDADCDGYQSE
ncbi:MAG: hypothetical protein ACFCA4_02855 [Cyanophyceae cyanobacterium]